MKRLTKTQSYTKPQQGAALLVVLVLLAIVTVIGVSNMQSASMEMKMIASTLDRNRAFAIANTAITLAETQFESENFDYEMLYTDTCNADDGDLCFNSTCTNGLCFSGLYQELNSFRDERYECQVSPSSDGRPAFWEDESVWSSEGSHRTVSVSNVSIPGNTGAAVVDVKYIIEFLCFVQADDGVELGPAAPNNGKALFRFTVFLENLGSGRTPIMLQTTYAR